VGLDEIPDHGAGPPECDAGVGILDRGETAVGVDGCVFRLLVASEGKPEFFEKNDDLGGIRAALAPDFDWLESHGGIGGDGFGRREGLDGG